MEVAILQFIYILPTLSSGAYISGVNVIAVLQFMSSVPSIVSQLFLRLCHESLYGRRGSGLYWLMLC